MQGNTIRFAIVGPDNNHAYHHARILLNAGAELACFFADKPESSAEFAKQYPHIRVAESLDEVLEDDTIDVIAGAPLPPATRAELSIKAMQHGKDVLIDKPAVTTLEQLLEIERVQRESGRIWAIYSNEHHGRRCTILGEQLVAQGAIGRVIQTTGFGPHLLQPTLRPSWFWDKASSGGIIGDIGAHQIEQFLFFTGSESASIAHARTGNFANPEHPDFEDYGEVSLEGDGGLGWFRVDWCSPPSLNAAGDIRLFVLGTDGYMEMRKYTDPGGRDGAEHLLVVNQDGARFMDTSNVQPTFGQRFLADVRDRTGTAISQERSFLVSRLAMEASMSARRVTAK